MSTLNSGCVHKECRRHYNLDAAHQSVRQVDQGEHSPEPASRRLLPAACALLLCYASSQPYISKRIRCRGDCVVFQRLPVPGLSPDLSKHLLHALCRSCWTACAAASLLPSACRVCLPLPHRLTCTCPHLMCSCWPSVHGGTWQRPDFFEKGSSACAASLETKTHVQSVCHAPEVRWFAHCDEPSANRAAIACRTPVQPRWALTSQAGATLALCC